MLRTKLTGTIETNEYAIAFIGAGVVETLGQSAVSAGANAVYNASLNFFPGLIFLVFAITGLIPIAMMWYDCCEIFTTFIFHRCYVFFFSFSYLAFLERKASKNINEATSAKSNMLA